MGQSKKLREIAWALELSRAAGVNVVLTTKQLQFLLERIQVLEEEAKMLRRMNGFPMEGEPVFMGKPLTWWIELRRTWDPAFRAEEQEKLKPR